METLGLDTTLIIAQIISFALLFTVLKKFLYPKIEEALQKRRDAIKATHAGREEIETRLKEFDQDQEAQRTKSRQEMKKLLAEAKAQAVELKKDIQEEAKEAAQKERAQVLEQIDRDKAAAKTDITHHANTIAKSIVQQLLDEKAADPKWQRNQIENSLKTLKKLHE